MRHSNSMIVASKSVGLPDVEINSWDDRDQLEPMDGMKIRRSIARVAAATEVGYWSGVKWALAFLIFAGLLWLWQMDGDVPREDEEVESEEFEGVVVFDLWMPGFVDEFILRSRSEERYANDDLKLRVVDGWLAVSSELDFGPILGRENPGALDLGLVREAVEKAEMSDEVRGEITELLDERAE